MTIPVKAAGGGVFLVKLLCGGIVAIGDVAVAAPAAVTPPLFANASFPKT